MISCVFQETQGHFINVTKKTTNGRKPEPNYKRPIKITLNYTNSQTNSHHTDFSVTSETIDNLLLCSYSYLIISTKKHKYVLTKILPSCKYWQFCVTFVAKCFHNTLAIMSLCGCKVKTSHHQASGVVITGE